MIALDLFFISLIVSYCIDISDGWNGISSMISGWLTKGKIKKPFDLRPFSCSLCASWWCMLIYLIVMHQFTLGYIVLAAVFSYFTNVYPTIFHFVESFIYKIFSELGEHFNLE